VTRQKVLQDCESEFDEFVDRIDILDRRKHQRKLSEIECERGRASTSVAPRRLASRSSAGEPVAVSLQSQTEELPPSRKKSF
jgi:hypothetical protein